MRLGSRRLRVVPVIGLQAAPDTANARRVLSLQAIAGRLLNGTGGNIVGVDRGDPTVSFNGPVASAPNPAVALNAVAVPASSVIIGPATIAQAPQIDPDLSPYKANLLARMSR